MNTTFENRLLRALDALDRIRPSHREPRPRRFTIPAEHVEAVWEPVQTQGYKCCVYFIRCGEFIKIGVAGSLRRRIATLRTSSPLPLDPLGLIACDCDEEAYALEEFLHARFKPHRTHGEWFTDCPELRQFILEHCREAGL